MRWIEGTILCFLFVSAIESYHIKISNFLASKDLPIAHNHTRKLLELCFSDRLNPVVITPDLTDIIYGITDNKEKNISGITINHLFRTNATMFDGPTDNLVYPSYPTFVFTANSLHLLQDAKLKFRHLNYWSDDITFLVIGNHCNEALNTLSTMGMMGISISFFICPNEFNNDTKIYTLNPYSNRAPELWQEVYKPGKIFDAWTFYKMSFINDAKICPNVTFDKTEFLDGAQVSTYEAKTSNARRTGFFFENLFSAMNITEVRYRNRFLVKGNPLIITDPKTMDSQFHLPFQNTIPYFVQNGYVIITQKKSFVPTLDQLIDSFFTREMITISSVILIVIFLMMFLNHKYDFGAATLDLLSFLLDMEMSTPFHRFSMRITLMSATLFALIFNPVLQGQLTSLLTRPGHRNVESITYLKDNNYQIYCIIEETCNELYSHEWKESAYKNVHSLPRSMSDLCLEKVKSNPSAACLVDFSTLEPIDESFYISNEFSLKYRVFTTYSDNPFNKKINKLALKLFETGHLNYYEKHEFHKILLKRKKKLNRIKARRKHDQLDLEDFELAYISMALALAWTIFVIGIEIMTKKIIVFLDKRAKKAEFRKLMIRRRIASTVRRIAVITQQL